jgi:adenine/guanine/hypoxanthine permease
MHVQATGCTLVIVGCLMMRQITSINWNYIGDALPAFVTIMFIPFSYSTAYGLIAGILSYTIINGVIYLLSLASRGRIEPEDYDNREYWTIRPNGKLPWFFTAARALTNKLQGKEVSIDGGRKSSSSSRNDFVGGEHEMKDHVVVHVRDEGYTGTSSVQTHER